MRELTLPGGLVTLTTLSLGSARARRLLQSSKSLSFALKFVIISRSMYLNNISNWGCGRTEIIPNESLLTWWHSTWVGQDTIHQQQLGVGLECGEQILQDEYSMSVGVIMQNESEKIN